MTGTKELQLSIIPSEFCKWGLGSQLGRGVQHESQKSRAQVLQGSLVFPSPAS